MQRTVITASAREMFGMLYAMVSAGRMAKQEAIDLLNAAGSEMRDALTEAGDESTGTGIENGYRKLSESIMKIDN